MLSERSCGFWGWRQVASRMIMFVALSAALAAAEPPGPSPTAAAKPRHPLVWDAMEKTLRPKLGETSAAFQYTVTNTSDKPVTIDQIRPTCGCTIAEMPRSPWVLAPGETGTFVGTIDLREKEGTLSKALFVNSSAGTQMLGLNVKIPVMDEAMRQRNQAAAKADRQAVFRGDCAACHARPTVGRSGGELFSAACGVCHLSERRATMVPDLLVAKEHRDAAYWRKWITDGKEGTLMPAWSKEHGGPLSSEQIESLVEFALAALPTDPPASLPPAAPASAK
jgi:mono/diheme cytochrome c family protein